MCFISYRIWLVCVLDMFWDSISYMLFRVIYSDRIRGNYIFLMRFFLRELGRIFMLRNKLKDLIWIFFVKVILEKCYFNFCKIKNFV